MDDDNSIGSNNSVLELGARRRRGANDADDRPGNMRRVNNPPQYLDPSMDQNRFLGSLTPIDLATLRSEDAIYLDTDMRYIDLQIVRLIVPDVRAQTGHASIYSASRHN